MTLASRNLHAGTWLGRMVALPPPSPHLPPRPPNPYLFLLGASNRWFLRQPKPESGVGRKEVNSLPPRCREWMSGVNSSSVIFWVLFCFLLLMRSDGSFPKRDRKNYVLFKSNSLRLLKVGICLLSPGWPSAIYSTSLSLSLCYLKFGDKDTYLTGMWWGLKDNVYKPQSTGPGT